MSAFVVSDDHINVLLTWANKNMGNVIVYNGKEGEEVELSFSQVGDLQKMANILRSENIRSVNTRYNEDTTLADLPVGFTFYHYVASPVEIIKACQCYDYQACENEKYPSTDAHRIIEWIMDAAVSALPGYDKARWDW